jgi:hypothetical protein
MVRKTEEGYQQVVHEKCPWRGGLPSLKELKDAEESLR